MSLITKYRPKNLEEIAGNENVIESLQSILGRSDYDDIPHAFMFTGPSGCGKTTLARIVAKAVGCSEENIQEIDTASYTGVDGIRKIRDQMRYKSMGGGGTAWILDECHRLSGNAQDALLKALEEPPEHVFFILCTTDPQSMRKAVMRRCSQHEVQPLEEKPTIRFLKKIVDAENAKVPAKVLRQIAQDSLGQPGSALAILDKVVGLDEDKMMEVASAQAVLQNEVIELCRAMMKRGNWKRVSGILSGLKEEPETIRRAILGYCNAILLKGDNAQAFVIMDEMIDPFFQSGRPGLTVACYRIVMNK